MEITKDFENIWIECNVKNNREAERQLDDNDYIDYHIWEDIHWREMYTKHLPNTMVFRGNNPILVFHGGCLTCKSQQLHGIDRCKGCSYFKFEVREKPDLSIREESK